MIGVNEKSSGGGEAQILGHSRNPLKRYDPNPTSTIPAPLVIFILLLMAVMIVAYGLREQKKTNVKRDDD